MQWERAPLAAAFMALSLLTFTGAGCALAGETVETTTAPGQPSVGATPLVFAVMSQPWAVEGSDGQYHLVYEVRISNAADVAVRLDRVSVLDAKTDKPISTFDAKELGKRFEVGASREKLDRRLEGAAFGVLFLHVAVASLDHVPAAIVHQIDITLDPDDPTKSQELTLNGGWTAVKDDPAVVLGPPLRGGNYLAGDSCCDTVRHVRALLPLNGRFWLAQRFAIDWEQIDDDYRIFVGDRRDVRSYHIYGKPVLAVADGKAIVVRDGLPEQVPHDPEPVALEDADGNHVLQDIGNGAFVLYAHMKTGSVRARVKQGALLRKGQVIGLVGNTGNTIAPHLHLHVVSGPSTLTANGIPYVFEQFKLTGFDALGTPDFDKGKSQGTPLAITPIDPPTLHNRQLPLDLVVVDWVNGGRRTGQQ